jgi:hypothetical protein
VDQVSADRIAEIKARVYGTLSDWLVEGSNHAIEDSRFLLAEVERLTAELAEAQATMVYGARLTRKHRDLADFLVCIPGQIQAMDERDEGPSAAAIRIIGERDATIAKLTAELADVCTLTQVLVPDGHLWREANRARMEDLPTHIFQACRRADRIVNPIINRAALDAEGQEPAAEPDARKLEFAEGKVTSTAGNVKSAGENPEPAAEPGCVNCGHEKSSHGEYLSMTQPPVKTECYYRSCRCTLFSPAAEGAGGEESGH